MSKLYTIGIFAWSLYVGYNSKIIYNERKHGLSDSFIFCFLLGTLQSLLELTMLTIGINLFLLPIDIVNSITDDISKKNSYFMEHY